MSEKQKNNSNFDKLVEIMAKLRAEDGCPWDREQTHMSLRKYLLEESYEVLEAIDAADSKALCEELGDLLLQVVFHAQIASESNTFDIDDIIAAVSEKLIRRHPNVFGDVKINSAAEQSINWEKIKKDEGKKSVLDGVPKALSALLRAHRIQQKATTVGFDWPDIEPVWEKVFEELHEFKSAVAANQQKHMQEEYGDLLFSLVNLGRFIDVDPEDALRATTDKFIDRFGKVEKHFRDNDKPMEEATLTEMDAIWERAKKDERSKASDSSR
jgi:tetrapyrrole methylase family protein/MazG family protein